MSPVKPYQQLREDLAQRDRSLREKVVALEDAASFVRDGDLVGIGGSTMSRTPMALIWALNAWPYEDSFGRHLTFTFLLYAAVGPHIAADWADQVARSGYATGIEALWYHATLSMATMEEAVGDTAAAARFDV